MLITLQLQHCLLLNPMKTSRNHRKYKPDHENILQFFENKRQIICTPTPGWLEAVIYFRTVHQEDGGNTTMNLLSKSFANASEVRSLVRGEACVAGRP